MRKSILIIIYSFLVLSCNKTQKIINRSSFEKILSESSQITIKLHDSTEINKQSRNIEFLRAKKTYNVLDKKMIDFKRMFENAEMTGYCCCPIPSYSISFLENNKKVNIFYVDAFQFKDKVRIYEGSYQYSYIIEKQKWVKFLGKIAN